MKKSEVQYRTSLDNLMDCLGIYSAIRDDTHRITDFRIDYVNKSACKSNDMTEEEQIGKKLCELLPSHRETGLFDEYCEVVETGVSLEKISLVFEDVYKKKRLIRAFDIRVSKMEDGFMATWRDVTDHEQTKKKLKEYRDNLEEQAKDLKTINEKLSSEILERKRMLKELQESEEKYRSLFSNMINGIAQCKMLYDENNKPIDWIYLEINEAFEKITGIKRDIIGKKVTEAIPGIENDVPELFEYYGKVAKTGEDIKFEIFLESLNIWFHVQAYSPEKGYFVAIFEDATERKNAEKILHESEARFHKLFDESPIGAVIEQNGIISGANLKFALDHGYNDIKGLVGKLIVDLYPSGIKEQLIDRDFQGMKKEEITNSFETIGLKKDGSSFPAQIKVTNIDLPDGSAILGFSEDLTEIKKIEEDRLKLESQIQQVQKLESLGLLAGGIAHDFNNLLVGILGSASLVMAELPIESPSRPLVELIQSTSEKAAELTKQMLAYSGRGQFVKETCNINLLIEEMTYLLETSVSKSVVIKYNFGENLPLIEVDVTQIRQIIMNLVINGSEAIGNKSGIITFTTGVMEADMNYLMETYVPASLQEGIYVYLEVSDTGDGMYAEIVNKIFDPFFTTKFTGRGLGLAAVLGIVRGHLGAIKVYTEKGKGSTFKVLLPITEKSLESKKVLQPFKMKKDNIGKILVCDDEETVRLIAKQMLESHEFSVLLASDGREAVELYQKNFQQIELVILDMTMPHMNGEDAFREMRRINKNVKVILSSGYNEQEATNRFVGKGLAGFIQKPYTINTFISKIYEIL